MRKMTTLAAILGLGAALTLGASADETVTPMVEKASKLDVKKVCDVKANGLEKVLAVAEEYNPEAVKLGVEFKRLGITNSQYIKALKEAVKKKDKKVTVEYKSKGKMKKRTFATDFLDWRACHFAVRALQQVKEAQQDYRKAIPGDGYKF
jgi:phage host-nuclease inhibitor protein Gam